MKIAIKEIAKLREVSVEIFGAHPNEDFVDLTREVIQVIEDARLGVALERVRKEKNLSKSRKLL